LLRAENGYDLTIIIPALCEADNLELLLPRLHEVTNSLGLKTEVVVVDEKCDERTREVVTRNQAVVLTPDTHGYGKALWAGLSYASSNYIVTMDADLSHPPTFLEDMWNARLSADVIIASRYVPGGQSVMPASRYWLSRILNLMFSRGLDLKVRDMSSGYRLYNRRVIQEVIPESIDFNVLQELLVKAYIQGFSIKEVPFCYEPRRSGSSHARVLKFGMAYLRTFGGLWKLRNSIASADYDYRAYDSWVLPQRYWQRMRYKYISRMVKGEGACLDIGCGSSRILSALPPGSMAVDILFRKLRFARRYGLLRLQGSLLALPVAGQSFSCVVCSQVIEHISHQNIMDELDRVLQPGGYLILGTPDYAKWEWHMVEWIYKVVLPQAYADEHITHYTYAELINEFVNQRGYQLKDTCYILNGELILGLQKPIK
jgi:dolichol-phosphate mannosyltransferase